MLMLSTWLRQKVLSLSLGARHDPLRRPERSAAFSAEEVKARLHDDPRAEPRTAVVHAAAREVSGWTDLLSRSDEFVLGRTASRLPTVIFWYQRGLSTEEIGQRLGPFGGSWDGERALAVASRLIATHLNR